MGLFTKEFEEKQPPQEKNATGYSALTTIFQAA